MPNCYHLPLRESLRCHVTIKQPRNPITCVILRVGYHFFSHFLQYCYVHVFLCKCFSFRLPSRKWKNRRTSYKSYPTCSHYQKASDCGWHLLLIQSLQSQSILSPIYVKFHTFKSQKYLYSSYPFVSHLGPQAQTAIQPATFHHFQGIPDVKITQFLP